MRLKFLSTTSDSGKFERHPNLKLCISEGGIGWIPPILQTADSLVRLTRERITLVTDPENEPILNEDARRLAQRSIDERSRRAEDALLPSELFRRHIYGCFITDPVGVKTLEEIGADNVMVETDFPHHSTVFPNSLETALDALRDVSPEVRYKVLRGNAEHVFGLTPVEPPLLATA